MIRSSIMARTALLLSFIVFTFYCYGAGMVDYFGVYEPWKLIDEEDFPAFHRFQGERIINIFVIPSAVMTLLNILVWLFPPPHVNRKLVLFSLIAYTFDWIFSFTMQIPIQLVLEERKDMGLITELLQTNWWRFAADTVQFVIVVIICWQLFRKLQVQLAK
jgi:hypothetical protein